MNSHLQKLTKSFYEQDLHKVAKKLLGKIFINNSGKVLLSGRIVEVEAYDGSIDEASHSYNGKTKRNEIMFSGGGLLYVYFTYGMHFCANVVTGKVNDGNAVLIRAVEPIEGIDEMMLNRFGKKSISQKDFLNLTNGPAKFAQAFNITKAENGTDLCSNNIFIKNNSETSEEKIICTTRIGIKKSVDLPWRYYIKDNPFISRK